MAAKIVRIEPVTCEFEFGAPLESGKPSTDKLPGLGQRQVSLKQFTRRGLTRVSNSSFIRNEQKLFEAKHEFMLAYEEPDKTCAGCKRSFGDIYNYGVTDMGTSRPAKNGYAVVKLAPENPATGKVDNRHSVLFCWDCAKSRKTMIASIEKAGLATYFAGTVAADAQDVYGFVELVIANDEACRNPEHELFGMRLKLFVDNNIAPAYYRRWDGHVQYDLDKIAPDGRLSREHRANIAKAVAIAKREAKKATAVEQSDTQDG